MGDIRSIQDFTHLISATVGVFFIAFNIHPLCFAHWANFISIALQNEVIFWNLSQLNSIDQSSVCFFNPYKPDPIWSITFQNSGVKSSGFGKSANGAFQSIV